MSRKRGLKGGDMYTMMEAVADDPEDNWAKAELERSQKARQEFDTPI